MGVNTYIEFDGVSSKDLGVVVEGYPGRVLQERDIDFFDVPGRNGSLLIDYGRYKNYTQEYVIHWFDKDISTRDVSEWLNKSGYKQLVDDSHPSHYRMASFIGPIDVENRLNVLGRCKISFNCKPQFFRVLSDDIGLQSGIGEIENTGQPSLPLLYIAYTGYGGTIYIGDNQIKISEDMPQEPFYFDCETNNAYSVDGVSNLNKYISLNTNGLIYLNKGKTTFDSLGGIYRINVSPRWWDLA